MAIGVNWKEIWAPVWGPVWTQSPPEPPAPDAPRDEVTGGGNGYFSFERTIEAIRREKERRKRREKERERELADIELPTDRQIAELLDVQEAKDAERKDLARIQAIADSMMREKHLPRPILAAVMKAHEERSRNALQQLERMVVQRMEEEEMAALMFLLND